MTVLYAHLICDVLQLISDNDRQFQKDQIDLEKVPSFGIETCQIDLKVWHPNLGSQAQTAKNTAQWGR